MPLLGRLVWVGTVSSSEEASSSRTLTELLGNPVSAGVWRRRLLGSGRARLADVLLGGACARARRDGRSEVFGAHRWASWCGGVVLRSRSWSRGGRVPGLPIPTGDRLFWNFQVFLGYVKFSGISCPVPSYRSVAVVRPPSERPTSMAEIAWREAKRQRGLVAGSRRAEPNVGLRGPGRWSCWTWQSGRWTPAWRLSSGERDLSGRWTLRRCTLSGQRRVERIVG